MNSAPNQPGNSFGAPPAGTQNNNPFTNDLKGEFTSNFGGTSSFGTNTNAVSQIFKDGNLGGGSNSKYYVMGGVLLFLAFIGWYMLGDSSTEEVVADPDAAAEEADAAATAETAALPADAAATTAATEAVAEVPATAPAAATGSIQLVSPEDGASLAYDETLGSASFSWSGGPGTIVFARNSSMKPEVMRIKVSGGSYSFHRPWPGQWFWKVETEGGASDVRSFNVNPPVRRNVALTAPQSGGTLAGTGGSVTWTGDSGVAYYRVELNQTEDWSNPQFKFSSSGSQVQLNGVAAGNYSMRLGAFSEVSGRWEFTQAIPVVIQ